MRNPVVVNYREDATMKITVPVCRISTVRIMAATALTCLVGSAFAADMTGADVKALISGKSVYLETTAASASGKAGQGVVYVSEDGTALYKTPPGAIWHGKVEFKANTLCFDWKEKPNNPCVRYDKTGDTITILDAVSGQLRAKVVKIAPGNAEKLAP